MHHSDKEIEILKSVLEQEEFQSGKPVVFLPNGDAHLDVIFSKDNQFAAAQLKEYIPFAFQPVSSIYYFYQAAAGDFIEYVKRYVQYVKRFGRAYPLYQLQRQGFLY
ncbi:MAG: hypothetical protein LBT25_09735 [Candidatus Symbiothrix sp.]|jgi:hypothetical protein|nr:hypothetical protein [Candidatus Symbiothrix sp.]